MDGPPQPTHPSQGLASIDDSKTSRNPNTEKVSKTRAWRARTAHTPKNVMMMEEGPESGTRQRRLREEDQIAKCGSGGIPNRRHFGSVPPSLPPSLPPLHFTRQKEEDLSAAAVLLIRGRLSVIVHACGSGSERERGAFISTDADGISG